MKITITTKHDYDTEIYVDDDATYEDMVNTVKDALVDFGIDYYDIVSVKSDKGKEILI